MAEFCAGFNDRVELLGITDGARADVGTGDLVTDHLDGLDRTGGPQSNFKITDAP